MRKGLKEKAERIINEPYTIEIVSDKTTKGNPVFLLSIVELPGCMAQGASLAEASGNLQDAMREYVLSLLEDGLPVPPPGDLFTDTTVDKYEVYDDIWDTSIQTDFMGDLLKAVQPEGREKIGEITPVG